MTMMLRKVFLLGCLLGMGLTAYAQQANFNGLYYAAAFADWTVPAGPGGAFSWSGTGVCTVTTGGTTIKTFTVGTPVLIQDANPAHNEIVTPSQVNYSNTGCSISVSPAPTYQHFSYSITTATAGLQEAINYALTTPTTQAVIYLTPAWTKRGGTTAMITAANGAVNVGILDQRSALPATYSWSGSGPYTLVPSGGGVTQVVAGTNVTISPSGGTGAVTINASGGGGGGYPNVFTDGLTPAGLTTTGKMTAAAFKAPGLDVDVCDPAFAPTNPNDAGLMISNAIDFFMNTGAHTTKYNAGNVNANCLYTLPHSLAILYTDPFANLFTYYNTEATAATFSLNLKFHPGQFIGIPLIVGTPRNFAIPEKVYVDGQGHGSIIGCNNNCGATVVPVDINNVGPSAYSALTDNALISLGGTVGGPSYTQWFPQSANTSEGSIIHGLNGDGRLYTTSGAPAVNYHTSPNPVIGVSNYVCQNQCRTEEVGLTNVDTCYDFGNAQQQIGGSFDGGPYHGGQCQMNIRYSSGAGIKIGQNPTQLSITSVSITGFVATVTTATDLDTTNLISINKTTPIYFTGLTGAGIVGMNGGKYTVASSPLPGDLTFSVSVPSISGSYGPTSQTGAFVNVATNGVQVFRDMLIQSGNARVTTESTASWTTASIVTAADVVINPNSLVLTSPGAQFTSCTVGNTVGANTYIPTGALVTACTSTSSISISLPTNAGVQKTAQSVTLAQPQITGLTTINATNAGDVITSSTNFPVGTRILNYLGGGVATITALPTAPGTSLTITATAVPNALAQIDEMQGNIELDAVNGEGTLNGIRENVIGGGAVGIELNNLLMFGLATQMDSGVQINATNTANQVITYGDSFFNVFNTGIARLVNYVTGSSITGSSTNSSTIYALERSFPTGALCEFSSNPSVPTTCGIGTLATLAGTNNFTGGQYWGGTVNRLIPTSTASGANYGSQALSLQGWGGSMGTPAALTWTLAASVGSGATPNSTLMWGCPNNALACYNAFGTTALPVIIDAYKSPRFWNTAGTFNWTYTFTGGASRTVAIPDGNSATTMAVSMTTTAATSDNFTITGMTSSGHCSLTPTNTAAATNVATTYISAKTTNQITVTHAGISGMIYDILCTSN